MAVAVVSEFNPFHNGHKYLTEKARRITGENVLAVMSGSFTQRGEVAVTDKFSRAEAALQNGVSLVVELPTAYAAANAERFARGGVEIAKAFECVNYLAFGCETDNLDLLKKAAFALNDGRVKKVLSQEMKNGSYYPKALELAVRQVFGADTADVLTLPNNILAVEYLRALEGSRIKPLPIKRLGVPHDSGGVFENIASASRIRDLLRSGKDAGKYMPFTPSEITYPEKLERAILCKLRSMSAADFKALPDVGEGLENRLFEAVKASRSTEEIISRVKTKRYTHARLRRIIVCAFLGITEELQRGRAEYARILGFDEAGADMLKSCRFQVVTSVAKAVKAGGVDAEFLKKDVLATDLAALAFEEIKPCSEDYLTKIIKKNSAK